jgi:spermidine/putrescine transport system ATP-binding protein
VPASEAPPILSMQSISKRFGDVLAVDSVTLDIEDGEFFTIVGPSGSGKSTLVRILAGLEQPTAGRVFLRKQDITPVPANLRPTCMVFQSLALFTHRSVGENIEFAAKMKRIPKADRKEHALATMDIVRLPRSYYDRSVTQCSGGERQRVALARALASDPEILFFDEPLSAMDYRLRKILEVEMKDLHRRTGKTFIYITHSLEEAMVMSDRIAIMRNGRIVQAGTPTEIYQQPSSRFVAEFMGEVNTFTVRNGRIEELGVAVDEVADGYLIVRPEYLRHLDDGDRADVRFPAKLDNDYMLGSRTQFHLSAGDEVLVAEVPAGGTAALNIGESRDWGFDLGDAARVAE